ncbi:uncharacterized protein LOC107780278 isoform X2 [Nicotiana tabacum]|uniref:Uncharacterized protein LOC107780278 isoform X2 n=1 Tax=Nicotiana tabacum TaxID=4097 RepID=A0AC58SVL5_TOBAC
MIINYVYLISVLYLSFFFHLVRSQLHTDQINTMRKIYDMLQNDTATSFVWDGINKSSNPCSWKGISCNSNDNSSITNISFSLFSISSSDFLPVICQINTLESLDVSQNNLSSLPDGFITGCGGLIGLNFSRNRLEDSLPNFTGFGNLESLDFSHSNLNGKVDLQLDGLNSLKSLNLSFNNFSGSVPTSLGKFNLLEELQLSANVFQEYAYVMRVTEAGNMYNFGVIMLELLTGKPAISEGMELAKWVLSKSIQHEDLGEVLDSRVSGKSTQVHQQMLLVLEIALQCLSVSSSERPDAKELLETLLTLGQQFGI